MNNNHNNKLIKLESLDNVQQIGKLQELSLDEVASIQGGMMAEGFPPLTAEEYKRLIELFNKDNSTKYPPKNTDGIISFPGLPVIL